jgi:hypothetical protein
MPEAVKARQVLRVAEESVRIIRDERPMGDRWVILWAASVTLLRTVGHALKKVDATSDERLEVAIAEAWERWKSNKAEHRVFWLFIDKLRNSILKEFELGAGQGVNIRLGLGDHEVSYPVDLDGLEELDQIELLHNAIAWWHRELDRIESRAGELT